MNNFSPTARPTAPPGVTYPEPNPLWEVIGLAAALTAIPVVIDLFTTGVNAPMLYIFTLLVLANAGLRRYLWPYAVLATALTLSLYIYHFGKPVLSTPHVALTWRLVNRLMVAFSICITTTALYLWLGMKERLNRFSNQLADQTTFMELADSLLHLFGNVICIALILCILAIDLCTPGEFNLPLLYALPIVIGRWMGSPRLLWLAMPLIIAASIVGYLLGAPANVQPDWFSRITTNRVLAIFVMSTSILILIIRDRQTAKGIG
ncbi:MAG: hypothetical protein ACTHM6_15430 [Tepidisphaeraceae bacterium]